MSTITLIAVWVAATLVGIGVLVATQPSWDRRRAPVPVPCEAERRRTRRV